ncbi:MAG: transporter substrate-binding domain-containing protein [Micrococcales bacterium]|nr:transporter substrate-binding domain-containing protein [Micrococcales bacterium]
MKSRRSFRVAIAVAALSSLALAGCGSSDSGSPSDQPSVESTNAAGVTLVQPGKLTVCTHLPYAPFEANDDSGQTVGFDIDLMDLIGKKLGVETAVVDTPFEGIKSGQDMSTGKCDIAAAGMTITPEREKAILFSAPYFDATQALLVRSGSTVGSLADLKDKKLGAQSATTGLDYAKKHQSENGYRVVEFQDLASETQALLTSQVDAAINDLPVWTEVVKKNPDKAQIAAQFDTGEQYGFGMKLGNEALKKVVDETLATAKSDGTYDTIYKKWIGDVPQS